MIRGGIADKFGNEYEDLWVVRQFLAVYTGSAEAIAYERIGEDGFEFSLQLDGRTEWHQCKTRSVGNWTIQRLHDVGVLSAFADKLRGEKNHCVFVSDTNAPGFKTLGGKANLVGDFPSFESALSRSNGGRADFDALVKLWKVDERLAYDWLKRCRVEIFSPASLEVVIRDVAKPLFVGSGSVLDPLRRFTRDRLAHLTSTEDIRAGLPAYGIAPRPNALDPTIRESIGSAADFFEENDGSRRSAVIVERPDLVEGILEWYYSGTQNHLFLSGGAGVGKSFVVAELSKALRQKGVTVLPFRLDRFLDLSRPGELGMELLDTECDPMGVLAEPRLEARPVLIIDQLDAVSDVSGRRRSAKELVFRLLKSNQYLNGAKVVLVCREYDIANDSRIKQLSEEKVAKTIKVPPLDWKADVELALQKAGIRTEDLTPRQRTLLCVPSSLAVFVRLVTATGHAPGFATSNDLVEQLVDLAQVEIRQDESWSVWEALGTVASRMSEDQTLSCPSAVLDRYPNARDRLQSAGLLTVDQGKIQFQHESHFDVIYARAFVATGKTLADWLMDDDQHLFRRTQVRQILAYLRLSAPAEYRRTLQTILSDTRIRYHIKDAVGNWLADLTDPTESELDTVLSLSSHERPDRLTRKAIFGKGWLGILAASGTLDTWLRQKGEWQECALSRVRVGMERDPRTCADILRRFLTEHPDRLVRALDNLAFLRVEEDSEVAADFLCELIEKLPTEAMKAPQQEFRSIWAGWDGQAELGIRIMAAWYGRLMKLDPTGQPFFGEGNERLRPDYHAREMATKAPVAFIERVGPLFLEALDRSLAKTADPFSHSGEFMWETSFPGETWGGLILAGLNATAEGAPEAAETFARLIPANCDPVALRYRLEAIAAGGSACASLFAEIIDREDLFESGGYTLRWRGTATAARAMRSHLAEADWRRFEDRVFTHRPEHRLIVKVLREGAAEGRTFREIAREDYPWLCWELRRSGYEQWAIARRVGFDAFSDRYRDELDVLCRKFANEPEPQEDRSRGGTVESPLQENALEKMDDAAWLSAMQSYDSNDSREYHNDYVRGGARELARALAERTKQDPERFANLLHRIPDHVNPVYPAEILESLQGAELSTEVLLRALGIVKTFPSEDGERAFIHLVRARPELLLDDRVFERVAELTRTGPSPSFGRSEDDDPNELQGAYSLDALFDRHSGGIYSYGSMACRLAALKAVNAALWEQTIRYDELANLVEERVDTEADPNVLALLVEPILAISTQERERGFILLARLARRDLRIVATLPAMRGYNWARWQDSEHMEFLCPAMTQHEHPALNALAFIWMAGEVLAGNRSLESFEPCLSAFPIARRAAALAAKDFLYDDRAADLALSWLETFASDDDPEVRREAYRANWHEILEKKGKPLVFVEEFIASEAFLNRSERLTMRLDDLADQHPRLALSAARRLVTLAEGDDEFLRQQMRHGTLTNVGKMIMGAYEGFNDEAPERQDALDLFDRFLAAGIYDVDRIIDRYERH